MLQVDAIPQSAYSFNRDYKFPRKIKSHHYPFLVLVEYYVLRLYRGF